MGKNKWCRLHTDIRSNWKLASVSDADRWVYICLLTCMTDGSLQGGAPANWLAGQCGRTQEEFLASFEALKQAGLVTPNGLVKNFVERQYQDKGNSDRQKRFQDKKKAEEKGAWNNVRNNALGITAPDTDTDTETEKGEIRDQAQEILAHLNQVTGRSFRNTSGIEACIKREKASVQDCKAVIDHKWREWGGNPDMAKNVNPTTPFRLSHFQAYLDEAQAGPVNHAQGEGQPTPRRPIEDALRSAGGE